MEERASRMCQLNKFTNGLDDARLIVCKLNGNKSNARPNQFTSRSQVNNTARSYRENRHIEAETFKPLSRVKYGLVFNRRHDNTPCFWLRVRKSLKDPIVPLRRPRGEKNLSRIDVQRPCDSRAGCLDHTTGKPTGKMST